MADAAADVRRAFADARDEATSTANTGATPLKGPWTVKLASGAQYALDCDARKEVSDKGWDSDADSSLAALLSVVAAVSQEQPATKEPVAAEWQAFHGKVSVLQALAVSVRGAVKVQKGRLHTSCLPANAHAVQDTCRQVRTRCALSAPLSLTPSAARRRRRSAQRGPCTSAHAAARAPAARAGARPRRRRRPESTRRRWR
jgi:hypothetical protein